MTEIELEDDDGYLDLESDIPITFDSSNIHLLLREILRNYTSLAEKCKQRGDWNMQFWNIYINFHDLKGCLNKLSKRKKEAIYWNVILDKRQADAAEIMGVTTVTIGQYVFGGCQQASRELWPELFEGEELEIG